jgi:hypothetical protein
MERSPSWLGRVAMSEPRSRPAGRRCAGLDGARRELPVTPSRTGRTQSPEIGDGFHQSGSGFGMWRPPRLAIWSGCTWWPPASTIEPACRADGGSRDALTL